MNLITNNIILILTTLTAFITANKWIIPFITNKIAEYKTKKNKENNKLLIQKELNDIKIENNEVYENQIIFLIKQIDNLQSQLVNKQNELNDMNNQCDELRNQLLLMKDEIFKLKQRNIELANKICENINCPNRSKNN